MKRYLGRFAALTGLATGIWLVANDRPATILALMHDAGWGLSLAACIHLLPMLANARDWQTLFRARTRPVISRMLFLVWLRESVNSLLPVARIGGEVVAYRMLRRYGLRSSAAAASLVVDMQLTVISQLFLTLAGIGYLLAQTRPDLLRLAGELALGAALIAPALLIFALVQHVSPFERAGRLLSRLGGSELHAALGRPAHIDQSIKLIWKQRGVILRYLFFWQPFQSGLTALELWVAARFLGANLSLVQSVVLELLIQAVSSAAFFVPGALGVQEGGFIVIGGSLGLDPAVSLALAGSRRIRDLMIFLPGLAAWQWTEFSVRQSSSVLDSKRAHQPTDVRAES